MYWNVGLGFTYAISYQECAFSPFEKTLDRGRRNQESEILEQAHVWAVVVEGSYKLLHYSLIFNCNLLNRLGGIPPNLENYPRDEQCLRQLEVYFIV